MPKSITKAHFFSCDSVATLPFSSPSIVASHNLFRKKSHKSIASRMCDTFSPWRIFVQMAPQFIFCPLRQSQFPQDGSFYDVWVLMVAWSTFDFSSPFVVSFWFRDWATSKLFWKKTIFLALSCHQRNEREMSHMEGEFFPQQKGRDISLPNQTH